MRRISEEEKRYIMSLRPEDITYELGMSLFADHVKKVDGKIVEEKSRFEPTDYFQLKAGEYINRTDIETTVGTFIFNKFIIFNWFCINFIYNILNRIILFIMF